VQDITHERRCLPAITFTPASWHALTMLQRCQIRWPKIRKLDFLLLELFSVAALGVQVIGNRLVVGPPLITLDVFLRWAH
jgi:hypothetical protein